MNHFNHERFSSLLRRTRHVKCDEHRPACPRCINTDRVCGGYPPLSVPRLIDIKLFDTTITARSYSYFVERTSGHIWNFYDASFSKGIVLQVGHVQPTISYALAALGSLHESSEASGAAALDEQASSVRTLSLQLSGKAILILIRTAESAPVGVLLISSIYSSATRLSKQTTASP